MRAEEQELIELHKVELTIWKGRGNGMGGWMVRGLTEGPGRAADGFDIYLWLPPSNEFWNLFGFVAGN